MTRYIHKVKNLIYVICWVGRQEEYVSETGDTLRHRVTVYKQHIREATRMLYQRGHIDNCTRNQRIKFKILPILAQST